MMYAVSAVTAHAHRDAHDPERDWLSTRHHPTFFLDSNVQGIVSEAHAASIARQMFDDLEVTLSCLTVTAQPDHHSIPTQFTGGTK